MRTLLVVVIASLAGACVVEEPVGELAGDPWSEAEAEAELQAEPDVEPIRWSPICVDHYVCCQERKLSDVGRDLGRIAARAARDHVEHVGQERGLVAPALGPGRHGAGQERASRSNRS